jgi:hypothetical protein
MAKSGASLGKGKAIRATDKALLVRMEDEDFNKGENEVWIPRSVIHDDSECYEDGDDGKVVVESWWAEKQGWT